MNVTIEISHVVEGVLLIAGTLSFMELTAAPSIPVVGNDRTAMIAGMVWLQLPRLHAMLGSRLEDVVLNGCGTPEGNIKLSFSNHIDIVQGGSRAVASALEAWLAHIAMAAMLMHGYPDTAQAMETNAHLISKSVKDVLCPSFRPGRYRLTPHW